MREALKETRFGGGGGGAEGQLRIGAGKSISDLDTVQRLRRPLTNSENMGHHAKKVTEDVTVLVQQ